MAAHSRRPSGVPATPQSFGKENDPERLDQRLSSCGLRLPHENLSPHLIGEAREALECASDSPRHF